MYAASDGRDLGAFIPSILDDYGLDLYEFRVYGRITRRAGGPRGCDESAANMAAAIGCDEKKVREVINLLALAGLIVKEPRPGTSARLTLMPPSEWVPADQLPQLREQAYRKRYPSRTAGEPPRSQGPDPEADPGPTDRTTPVPQTGHPGPTDRAPRSQGPTKVLPEGDPGKGESSASPRSAEQQLGAQGHTEVTLAMPDGRTLVLDPADAEGSFDVWWQAYPRHPSTNARGGGGGRKVTRQRWLKLSTPKRAKAIAAIGNYHAHLAVSGYPPVYAEKWLSQERWDDYAEPPATGAEGLDELELALAAAANLDPVQLTGEGRRDLVVAAAAIRRVDGTVDVLDRVAKKFRDTWPGIQPTPPALAKNWARFAPAITGQRSGPVCVKCGQPRGDHDLELCRILARTA